MALSVSSQRLKPAPRAVRPPDTLCEINRQPLINWSGRRVTVMGLGRHGGGLAAARYLAQHGAEVTVSDLANTGELRESLARLRDVSIRQVKLGGHDKADFRDAEFVVVNPAVRPDHPCLRM